MTAASRVSDLPRSAVLVGGLADRVLDPGLVVGALAVLELSNAGDVLGVGLLLPAMVWGLAAAGWAWLRGTRARPPLALLVVAGVWLAARLAVLPAALDVQRGWVAVVDTARDVVFLAIVVVLLAIVGRPARLMRVVVVVIAALAGLSLVNEVLFDGAAEFGGFSTVPLADVGTVQGRHAGPLRDVNFWGRVLVLVMPLALSAWATAHERPWRPGRHWWWAAAAGTIVAGVALTGSRGALLSLAVVLVVWPLAAGPPFRRSAGVVGVLLVVVALAVPGVSSRLATLLEITSGQGPGDPSLVERSSLQAVALDMAAAHPLVGVGPGNFLTAFDDHRAAADVLSVPRLAAHNLYLEIAAEQGVVGLVGWAVFFGGALVLTARGLRGGRAARRAAAGPWAGLVGFAVASIPLHLATTRTLLLVMAVGAALGREPALAAPHGRRARAVPAGRRVLLPVVAGLLAGGATAGVLGVVTERWGTQVDLAVRPGQEVPGEAYRIDLLSRELLMPTVAAVTTPPAPRDDGVTVEVVGTRSATVATMRVVAPTAQAARRATTDLVAEAVERGGMLAPHYELEPLAASAPVRDLAVRWPRVGVAVVVAMLAAIAAAATTGIRAPTRPAPARRTPTPVGSTAVVAADAPWRPFRATSPWNTPLDDAAVAPDSPAAVAELLADGPGVAHLLHGGVAIVDVGGPHRVHTPLGDLPVPAHARPAPGPRGQLVVLDRTAGAAIHLAGLRREGPGRWRAGRAEQVALDADGVGGGWPALAGVVRVEEVRAGVAHHALAVTSDVAGLRGGVRVGARLWLDATADAADLSPVERLVVDALATYGAIVVGPGPARLGVRFECPFGASNPYPAAGLTVDAQPLAGVPWAALRVVAPTGRP